MLWYGTRAARTGDGRRGTKRGLLAVGCQGRCLTNRLYATSRDGMGLDVMPSSTIERRVSRHNFASIRILNWTRIVHIESDQDRFNYFGLEFVGWRTHSRPEASWKTRYQRPI